jgi:inosine-uridine nucleoside N-ribohydrolase
MVLKMLRLRGHPDVPVTAGPREPLLGIRPVFWTGHEGQGLLEPEDEALAPDREHAVDFIVRTVMENPGQIHLIAVGPLTNVALFLALYPDLRPERVVLMGGAIGEGNRTPAAEFNIWADPEAARRVFADGLDTTMVGLDVTHRALIRDEHAERLRAAGRVGAMVAELLDFYSRFHHRRYPDLDGSPMHDPVCIAHLVAPDLLDVRDALIEVDVGEGPSRGRTNVDWRGREGFGPPNAKVAVGIDGDAFAELVVERISSL